MKICEKCNGYILIDKVCKCENPIIYPKYPDYGSYDNGDKIDQITILKNKIEELQNEIKNINFIKSMQNFQCPDCGADLEVKFVKHNN